MASDLAGYRNVARPEPDALLVPPGDADGPGRRRCAACSTDPVAGRGAGGLGRASGPSGFSMDHLAERYVELYERVPWRRCPPGPPLRRRISAATRGRLRGGAAAWASP